MLRRFDFEMFQMYVDQADVTDLNYNGKDLWVDDLNKGRYVVKGFSDKDAIYRLVLRLSNAVNLPYTVSNPIFETEIGFLRISVLHPTISKDVCISIRKTSGQCRYDVKSIIEKEYVSQAALDFLVSCIRCRCNVMISGLPGSGKTELLKFLTQFIGDKERVITLEDSMEIHYDVLHPRRDCVALKTSKVMSYDDAIKASLRQRPDWLLLSEVRGSEAFELLKCVSTGLHLISTIHARSAKEIPNRLLFMMNGASIDSVSMLAQIETLFDVGIHIDLLHTSKGTVRRVREIVVFNQGSTVTIYQHGGVVDLDKLPEKIKSRADLYGVQW
ncbi:CpaF/VirB11 family protein [Erysipelothrix anatis]|uniref:CpaF/VirB11 family protein n=1 Tax=Erysipelothrix anatis TaxID=2683713 RepID=UPI001357236F|nr:CpaF/VirB11 family protein [Erysipelothrix anatis]